MQDQINPKSVVPHNLHLWQLAAMSEKPFDPDLVREKMRELGVSQTALAKVIGLPSQSALSNILKGIRRITADEAAQIYDYLNIDREPNFRVANVIGIASAGNWREAIELPIGYMPYPPSVAGKRAFGIEVSGDSMDKLIDDGGWVLIDPDRKELRDESCYLISNGEGEATVKMYKRNPPRFEPCSTNPEHKAFPVSDADFSIIGQVVWKGGPVR